MFEVTDEMKAAAVERDKATNFRNRWVVFYPTGDENMPWDMELSSDPVAAREFYNEMKSHENHGAAVIMPLTNCWPDTKE